MNPTQPPEADNPAAGHPRRLVLLGGPGVGKGTQAVLLAERLSCRHLSTGDLFRAIGRGEAGELTPVMRQAMSFMRRGELIPDATVIDLVREHIMQMPADGGLLLDGFPRTVGQAEALDAIFEQIGTRLDAVLSYELPDAVLIERLGGRRTCAGCGATFHVQARPPKKDGVCDLCGGELIQRADDHPDAIAVRLQTYKDNTRPLIDFYRDSGRLVTVDAAGTPEQVAAAGLAALAAHLAGAA